MSTFYKNVTRLVVWLLLVCVPLMAQKEGGLGSEQGQKTVSVENEFLKISVNNGPYDQGRFSVDTTSGDPQNPLDDQKSLIFGRPIPWTSYTTVYIDSIPYVFGGINKKIEKRAGKSVKFGEIVSQAAIAEGFQTECRFGTIRVIQTLTFSRNPSTRVKDSVLISYEVINTDATPHQIGVRVMLDTKLGDNDGAPFRIGDRSIQSEMMFKGADIQDYWQAFDSLTSPNVIAQGSLRIPEEKVFPPDRLYLVNWGTVADNPWDFEYQEGRSFVREGELEKDTALALYWDPITLSAGKSTSYKTVYGLGGVSLASGALSLGLTAPAEAYATSKKDILVVGYVSNVGGFDSRDTKATFTLPSGLSLSGGKLTHDLTTLMGKSTRQIPIRVQVNPGASGPQKITFSVTSSTLNPNSISRMIDVIAAPKITGSLAAPSLKLVTLNAYLDISASVTNTDTRQSLDHIQVGLTLDPSLSLPAFESGTKWINHLRPQETQTVFWKIKVTNPSSKQAQIKARVSSPILVPLELSKTLSLSSAEQELFIEPSVKTVKKGDYFYVLLAGKYVLPFDHLNQLVLFDTTQVRYLRLSPEAWIEDTQQDAALKAETGKFYVSSLNNPKGAYQKRLCKLHFKALKEGLATFQLVQGNKVTTMTVQIEP